MTTCVHSELFFKHRNQRREKMLRKLENMRAAKERLRMERGAAGILEREPKLERYYPLELGLRDKRTGEMAWVDFKGIRDAMRRLSYVRKFYL